MFSTVLSVTRSVFVKFPSLECLNKEKRRNAERVYKRLQRRLQNRSKNKIRKITIKSRNDVKSACFWHVFCHISAIFEDIDLKFCTHIHQPLPSNILSVFLKILILRGKILKKKKNCRKFWKFWGIFKIFKIWDSSFVALLILRHFI